MAVIKIACPKCGQKVSGDETFYGRKVNCPICTSRIVFPDGPAAGPDLDSLTKASDQPPSQPAFDTVIPGSHPGPQPPPQPTFDTVVPGSHPVPQPPQQPTFDTVVPGSYPGPQPPQQPTFDTVAPGSYPEPARQFQPPGRPEFETVHPTSPSHPVPQPGQPSFETPVPPAQPNGPPADYFPERPLDQGVPAAETGIEVSASGLICMIIGILGTITSCVGGGVLSPVAIILGHLALGKARKSAVKPVPGQNFATIGLILGYVGLAVTIIFLIAYLVLRPSLLAPGLPLD